MARIAVLALLTLPVWAADPVLSHLLKSVESRYNSTKTLQVSFEEEFTGAGGRRQQEAGQLYLRKPGRMRWDYAKPAGKLFVSDGKEVYFYNPVTNRAEKTKLRETEDMRAPLAFLLGKLDFDKDFRDFTLKSGGKEAVVTAVPKSDKLPYKKVAFTVNPLNGYAIEELVVTGQDNSLLTFRFRNEVVNPGLKDNIFKFQLPAGAQWADLTAGQGGN